MSAAFGWDVGGVHLKGARCDGGGAGRTGGDRRGVAWRIDPLAIWREPQALAERIGRMARDLGAGEGAGHALTMTAELSDVFPDRAAGVRAILGAARGALGGPIVVLDVDGALIASAEAEARPERVAAANWMATAALAADLIGDGLLIDTGSTTTDIVPLAAGLPAPTARDDTGRLRCGELVYTGALRTPPAALADRVPLGAGLCRVAPEHFTQMADAYLLLGRIGAADYTVETADGRGRSRAECAARLARLIAAAPEDLDDDALLRIAAFLEERQVAQIAGAIAEVAGRLREPRRAIVAGAGAWLATAAARRAGFAPIALAEAAGLEAADGGGFGAWDVAAPAVALALRLADMRA
jgi:probable H4MPT-linked C1 transfer pathway protein